MPNRHVHLWFKNSSGVVRCRTCLTERGDKPTPLNGCPMCMKATKRKHDFLRHMEVVHGMKFRGAR